jgi:hypothetical protein
MPFSFKAAFGSGVNTFKSRYGSVLAAVVVFIVVLIGAAIVQGVLNAALGIDTKTGEPTWLDSLVTIFFTNVFSAGLALMVLQIHRGESPGMGTLFAGFGRYWPLVGIGLLMHVIFVGIILGVLLVGGLSLSVVAASTSSAFAVGPGFIIAALIGLGLVLFFLVRFFFVALHCIDPKRQFGVTASFGASWRATGPIFWPLLGLIIVLLAILIVSVVLLVLPVIFVGIPLMFAVSVAAYELATGDDSDSGETAKSVG